MNEEGTVSVAELHLRRSPKAPFDALLVQDGDCTFLAAIVAILPANALLCCALLSFS